MTRAAVVAPLAVVLVCLLVFFAPLAWLFREGVAEGGTSLLTLDARGRDLLLRSVVVAAGGGLLAVLLGVPLGVVLARGRAAGSLFWLALCAVPVATPVHALVTAWIVLLGRNGLVGNALAALAGADSPPFTVYGAKGVVLLLGLRYAPLVALPVTAALRSGTGVLEEDALLDTTPLTVLRRVSLLRVRPTVWVAAAVVVLLCLAEYELPSLLEAQVYPVEIVSQFQLQRRLDRVVAASLPLVALGALTVAAAAQAIRRRSGAFPDLDWGRAPCLLRARAWTAVPVLVLALPCALIFGSLAWRAGPPASYHTVFVSAWDDLLYTLWTAPLAALAAVLAALAVAWIVRSGAAGLRWGVGLCVCLPWIVPVPVFAVAQVEWWTLLRSGGIAVRDLPLVAATAVWLLPVAAAVVTAGVLQLDRDLLDAARVDGAGTRGIVRHVMVPLLAPTLGVAFLVCVVLGMGEVTLAVLLHPPGYASLAVRLASLLHYAPESVTAALCLVQYAMILVPTGIALAIARRLYLRPGRASL